MLEYINKARHSTMREIEAETTSLAKLIPTTIFRCGSSYTGDELRGSPLCKHIENMRENVSGGRSLFTRAERFAKLAIGFQKSIPMGHSVTLLHIGDGINTLSLRPFICNNLAGTDIKVEFMVVDPSAILDYDSCHQFWLIDKFREMIERSKIALQSGNSFNDEFRLAQNAIMCEYMGDQVPLLNSPLVQELGTLQKKQPNSLIMGLSDMPVKSYGLKITKDGSVEQMSDRKSAFFSDFKMQPPANPGRFILKR